MNGRKSRLIFLLFLLWFVGMYSTGYLTTYYHELTHKRIFEYYGIDAVIEINPDLSGKTIAEDASKCDKICRMLQYQTDIIGYHVSAIIQSMWLMFLIFLGSLALVSYVYL